MCVHDPKMRAEFHAKTDPNGCEAFVALLFRSGPSGDTEYCHDASALRTFAVEVLAAADALDTARGVVRAGARVWTHADGSPHSKDGPFGSSCLPCNILVRDAIPPKQDNRARRIASARATLTDDASVARVKAAEAARVARLPDAKETK
jgi:hypothetical protein